MTTLAAALGATPNRIVDVNQHHTSQLIGNFNTAPPATGIYQGYLIVRAEGCDPESGIFPYNIDARTVRFNVQGSSKKIVFWGFNILGELDIDGADIWFWYCALSHPANRATLGSWSSPLYTSPDCLNLDNALRPRVHGCTFRNYAHAIRGGVASIDSHGAKFLDPYPSTPKWNTHWLDAPAGGLTGTIADFLADDRYPSATFTTGGRTGRGIDVVTGPSDQGAVDLTLTRGWMKSSAAAAVNLHEDAGGSAITLREDPSVRMWDAATIGVNASASDGNISIVGSHTVTVPTTGSTDPAQAWRTAHPSDEFTNFAFGIRVFDDFVVAHSLGMSWTPGAPGYTPQGWHDIWPGVAAKFIQTDGFAARARHGFYTGNSGDYDFAKLVIERLVAGGGTGVLFIVQPGWPGLNVNNLWCRDDTAAHATADGALLQAAIQAAAASMRAYVRTLLGSTAGDAFAIDWECGNETSNQGGFTIKRDMLTYKYLHAGLKAGDPLCRVSPATTIITGTIGAPADPNRSNVLHMTATGGPKWLPYDEWVDRCNPAMCGSISGFGAVPTMIDTGFDFLADHDYDTSGGPNSRPPSPIPGSGTAKYETYGEMEAACDAYAISHPGQTMDPLRWNHTRWVPWIAQKVYDLDVAAGTDPAVAAERCVVSVTEVGWQTSSWRADATYPIDWGVVHGTAGKFRSLNPVPINATAPASDTSNIRWCPEWRKDVPYTVGKKVWQGNAFWNCTANVTSSTPPSADSGHWTKIRNSTEFAEGGSWFSEEQIANEYPRYFRQFFGFEANMDGIWMGGVNALANVGGAKAQRRLTDCMYPYEAQDFPSAGPAKFGFTYWGTRAQPDRSTMGLGDKGIPNASDGAYRKCLVYSNQLDPRFADQVVRNPGKVPSVTADTTVPNQAGFGWTDPTDPGVPTTLNKWQVKVDGLVVANPTVRLVILALAPGPHTVTVAASNNAGVSYGPESDSVAFTVNPTPPRVPGIPPAPSADVSTPEQAGFGATDPTDLGFPALLNRWRWKLDGVIVGTSTARLFLVAPLTAGTRTVRVAVSNDNGASYSGDSPPTSFTVVAGPPPVSVVPSAPLNVHTTPAGGGDTATLLWDTPSDIASGITGYETQCTGPAEGTPATTTHHPGNVHTDVFSSLAAGTYTLRVRASDDSGASYGAWSSTTTFVATVPPPPPQPSQPLNVHTTGWAAGTGGRDALVLWDAPADPGEGLTGYQVEHTPGGATHSTTDPDTDDLWTSLALGTHTFRVRATDDGGATFGGWSVSASFVATDPPVPPTVVVATAGDGTVAVDWLPAPGPEVTEQRVTPSVGSPVVVAGNVTHADITIANGTTVTFTVARAASSGPAVYGSESAASNAVTPQPAARPPGQPPQPGLDVSVANEVGVGIIDPLDKGFPTLVNRYEVKYIPVSPAGATTTTHPTVRTLRQTLTPGSYQITVAASNNGGTNYGPPSAALAFTVSASPPPVTADDPPTAVTATAGDGEVSVSWLPAPEADVVQQRITSSAGTITNVSGDIDTFTVTSPNGVTVTFTVARAILDDDMNLAYGPESAPSNPATPLPAVVSASPTVWTRVGRLLAGV